LTAETGPRNWLLAKNRGHVKCQLFAGISRNPSGMLATHMPQSSCQGPDLRCEEAKICNTLITISERKCEAKSVAYISGIRVASASTGFIHPLN